MTRPAPDFQQARVSYAMYDQALWNQFATAATADVFAGTWLALLCRNVPGTVAGVVVLGEPETGPFAPAAHWPEPGAAGPELLAAAEEVIRRRRPVLTQGTLRQVAAPILIEGGLYGVVGVSLGPEGVLANDALHQLRWASGWLEVLLRREQGQRAELMRRRTTVVFDVLATILEHRSFQAACTALVTELATQLRCDPVSIGFVRRNRVRVTAISHAAGVDRRMNPVRDIGAAMDEAVDQQAVVLWPQNPDWDYRVTLAHAELASSHRSVSVLTVPIQHDGEIIGALTLERGTGDGFTDDEVELVDAVATVVGPVIEERRRNDRAAIVKLAEATGNQLRRLLGPAYFGRKLATVVFGLVVAFLATARGDFDVTAPATIEGSIQRRIVAPFAGYLASENIRAGGVVREGELLAALDDKDLALERLRLATARAQRTTEFDQALAKRERAQASIIASLIKQADSQIALIDEQLARTRIVAPFDGIVVSGDLSQSIGAAIERGQELFRIAPLDSYRVVLEVGEGDISEIEVGQRGQLRPAPLPEQTFGYTIERITPVADQKAGRNFFRVEARLDANSDRLRPAMEGIARTRIDERLLVAIWTRSLVNWVRLAAWRWRP